MGMPPNSNAEGNQIGIIARFLVNTVDIPFSTSRDVINRKAWDEHDNRKSLRLELPPSSNNMRDASNRKERTNANSTLCVGL